MRDSGLPELKVATPQIRFRGPEITLRYYRSSMSMSISNKLANCSRVRAIVASVKQEAEQKRTNSEEAQRAGCKKRMSMTT